MVMVVVVVVLDLRMVVVEVRYLLPATCHLVCGGIRVYVRLLFPGRPLVPGK